MCSLSYKLFETLPCLKTFIFSSVLIRRYKMTEHCKLNTFAYFNKHNFVACGLQSLEFYHLAFTNFQKLFKTIPGNR